MGPSPLNACAPEHRLAFHGAINCRIVNNTVVNNPINAQTNTPWRQIFAHINSGTNGMWSNNIETTAYTTSGTSD